MNTVSIKNIVAKNAVPSVETIIIKDETSFIDLGYDSLQFIKLIVDIEEHYNINIVDELLDAKLFESYLNFERAILNLLDPSKQYV